MGNTISQQSLKVSLFLIGLLLMPYSVLAENNEQKVNFKDVYCSEGCDWHIRECPILGFQIASMLDRKTNERVDKLVFLRNDIVYGARHEKIREPDDAFVSVRNPTIVHQVKKIFPEIGDDFIAGINQVCGYEERVKKAKATEINQFYMNPTIMSDHAVAVLSCTFSPHHVLNSKVYYQTEYGFYGGIMYNSYLYENVEPSNWWEEDQKNIKQFCII